MCVLYHPTFCLDYWIYSWNPSHPKVSMFTPEAILTRFHGCFLKPQLEPEIWSQRASEDKEWHGNLTYKDRDWLGWEDNDSALPWPERPNAKGSGLPSPAYGISIAQPWPQSVIGQQYCIIIYLVADVQFGFVMVSPIQIAYHLGQPCLCVARLLINMQVPKFVPSQLRTYLIIIYVNMC